MNAVQSLTYFVPELVLLSGAFVAILLDLLLKNKKAIGIFALLVLASAAFCGLRPPAEGLSLFFGFFELDTLTYFFRIAALGIVTITILASLTYKPIHSPYEGEYYSLFLFMAFALVLMAASTNLLMIFLSIEFVSVLSYLLVGFLKKDARSKEAAIKYLLFGSVASAVMLFGMSLLYGASGSLDLGDIEKVVSQPAFSSVGILSAIFLLVGVGFKISMAPFHMWAPDVYEGAPTPVTAFLTVGPKAMGFAVLIRILSITFPAAWPQWSVFILGLSVLTMTIGNVAAVSQTNIKRLLAYSSIAQAGYILMGIVAFTDTGLTAVLIYLVAYAFTNLGAFVVVIAASNHFGNDEIESYTGLAQRSPILAASLTIFLLSLAGIPPMAGFIGKFYVFSSAIEAGFNTLAIAAALNSAVAAFYYFRIVRVMYLVPAKNTLPVSTSFALSLALFLMLAGTIVFGLAPVPLIAFVKGVLSL